MEVWVITGKTLYAYEQFCEEYYDNFDILGRSRGSYTYNMAIAPNSHLSKNRKDHLRAATGLNIEGEYPLPIPYYQIKNSSRPLTLGDETYYSIDKKRLDKLRMKRDPEYRTKRLREISERKEKNRATHELGQQRQKERSANPKKQSFLSQVSQAHKKHIKKISNSVRMIKDGITSR